MRLLSLAIWLLIAIRADIALVQNIVVESKGFPILSTRLNLLLLSTVLLTTLRIRVLIEVGWSLHIILLGRTFRGRYLLHVVTLWGWSLLSVVAQVLIGVLRGWTLFSRWACSVIVSVYLWGWWLVSIMRNTFLGLSFSSLLLLS